jgi:Helix-turn-helix.
MSESKTEIEAVIVDLVRKKRESLKKRQKDISQILGVTVGYIGQIESTKSKSMYSYDQLNLIAKEFGCSPKDFMPEKPV